MLSEYHFQRIVIEDQVLLSNQDLVWEVTICCYPQCEEKGSRTLHLQ